MTDKEFKQFFDKNFEGLRRYLYYRCGDSDLATDLAQDTLIRLWEKQIPYEGARTLSLAYKIANDLFISHYRHKQLEQGHRHRLALELDTEGLSPEELMAYEQLQQRYTQAIDAMPEGQREVFLMSRLDGLKYAEIAQRLDLSQKAVEKRMSAALGFLRESLGKALLVVLGWLTASVFFFR